MAPLSRLCLTLFAAVWTTTAQASVVVTINGNDQRVNEEERSLQSGGVFSLYTLPTFVARISSAVNQHVDDIPFGVIAMEFKTITEEYLEDFFAASLLTADTTLEKVHSVDLQVGVTKSGPSNNRRRLLSLRSLSSSYHRALLNDEEFRLNLRAEVTGSVSFVDPQDVNDKPSNERVEYMLKKFLAKAFDMDALPLFKKRFSERATVPILKSIEDLIIQTDVGTAFEPPPEEEEPKEQNSGGGGGGWDAKDFLICFLTGGFLLCSLACLYMYASRDYHERRREKAYRMADNGQHHLDDDHLPYKSTNDTQDEDDDQEVHVNQSDSAMLSPSQQRRYRKAPSSTAASPLDVIYGAAFMPHDRERVERERQKKRRKKKQQTKQRAPIKPMFSIAEEDSMSDGSQRSIRSFENGIGPWLRQLAACWSPGDKGAKPEYGDPNYVPKDGDVLMPQSEISPHGVDDLSNVVFRDFPRHDGTPCLMYNPTNNDDSSLPSQDVYISNNSTHSTGSLLSIGSATSSSKGEVDTFVDKLEHLMVMRHKQYEERMKMEEERAAFRKGKQDAKTNTTTNSYLPDTLATNKLPTPQKETAVSASPAAAATPTRHAAGVMAASTPPQTPTGDLLGVAGLLATPGGAATTPSAKSVATPAAATPAANSVATPIPAAATPSHSQQVPAATPTNQVISTAAAAAAATPRTAPPRLGFKQQDTTGDLLGIPNLVASEQKADKELLLNDKQYSPSSTARNLEKSLNKAESHTVKPQQGRTEAMGYEEEEKSGEGVFT